MKLDQRLVDAAIEFIKSRFPIIDQWSGAAAMYSATGKIFTSTYVECPNDGAGLCYETGSICEAHKLGETVTASICVSRSPKGDFHILTPCGICQERLFFWGPEVEVGVPLQENSSQWQMKKLSEVQPYYWRNPFLDVKKT